MKLKTVERVTGYNAYVRYDADKEMIITRVGKLIIEMPIEDISSGIEDQKNTIDYINSIKCIYNKEVFE